LDKDGTLSLFTSAVTENFQTSSLWKEIAGNILEITPEDVRLETTSTSLVPDSGPSLFSRNITIITQLIEKCCNAIKKSRFRLHLPIEVKRSFRLPRTNGWDPENFRGNPFPIVSWGAAVVETETNPITFETSIRGVWFAADCGKIMNLDLARAEVESEIFRSVINSTMKPPVQKYAKRGIPLTPVQPENHFQVHIDFLTSSESKPGGIGELPDSLIPSALSEALSMGLDIKLTSIPSTSESLYQQVEHKKNMEVKKIED
jgi:CO/xanthine dehydrogenase Mo-binding subunit